MLLTITFTFGEIRKQIIMVNQNFTELFKESREMFPLFLSLHMKV